ncbi:16S rRNA (adenine(1518)-N(6)/adenine(1519)-N(6))-dimethyltransferase RsmA [Candidatus Persebacteraceae bacterium Df01]|jgi:16S rRNA (adenine1518-N6/adenine1519-N6)-dimethyltransferase|uniref:Ribosomal RNA small subunit methyltransferase A n=1 Tax=Candidatus Doriopsillibacter californiensis TaxID=2970740 RepID=A0ABT7QN50_9GAMM|nr:16S rRNA (adenine(1518)-N(6)/adenine(1519)-N(6))-dimethyltransferase RsmA [Candidatus Persebacteraceae bacterium Df01]
MNVPRKRFGQHFLRDKNLINALLKHIAPQEGEEFLEIGPGNGALTEALLQAPINLTAIEIDRELADGLRTRFGKKLHLLVDDVLCTDLAGLLAGGNVRVAGNLPYNISTPLLLRLADCRSRDMHLMLQREVAMRLLAQPGGSDYGRLTVSVRLSYDVEEVLQAPPEAFWPAPKVHSTVVRLLPRTLPLTLTPTLQILLKAAFQSRRKMLGNALKKFTINWQTANIEPTRRPQTLSPEEFSRLATHMLVPHEEVNV